jgi:GntR family transcriptional regulator/MocR family aminotransferase
LTRSVAEMPITADRAAAVPLSGQISGQLRTAIASGRLRAGERLPASRALAASLGVSRTVITAAYAQLYAEGWLDGRHGSGTFVAAGVPDHAGHSAQTPQTSMITAVPGVLANAEGGEAGAPAGGPRPGPGLHRGGRPAPDEEAIDLSPGMPWTAGIDPAAWRRAWRAAGAAPPDGQAGPLGLLTLRTALAAQLRRHRGLLCGPGQIIITSGVASGLRLVATALLRPGDIVAVEEPGYAKARAIFAACGARVVTCRADEDGLVISELPAGARLVYTTPAHQYPLGGRLPVPRRQALIETAEAAGALIVEDDYDSEFRYDVAPLPALAGLAPDQVIHLGTTAKTLTPALGVGWLAARQDLITALARAAAETAERTCEPAQHALTALLASGDLDRHVRRMSREYARRRSAIVAALGGLPGPARLLGGTAGLHVVLELPAGTAAPVAAAAARQGVRVDTLDRYFAGPPRTEGLVLGYGGVSLRQTETACHILRHIVTSVITGTPPAAPPR